MRTFLMTLLGSVYGFSAFSAGKTSIILQIQATGSSGINNVVYLLLTIIIAMAVSFVVFVVFVHRKKIRIQQQLIEDKNRQLALINEKLSDNARFKEEYVGYFFSMISDYLLKIEKIKRRIERKIMAKRFNDILLSFNEIDIKKERETMFNTFDHTFLKIFPDYIAVFNSMLQKEDQVFPAKNELLCTDLRIFALMRLGISDCETIASFLEYSANTIYVYKMRIKAKSIVPADQFEQAIMGMKATTSSEPVHYRKSA